MSNPSPQVMNATNHSANTSVLSCRNLRMRFKEGTLDVEVLKSVNLNLNAGERVAIVGSSGSGKSTLLHLLGGLDLPTEGEVLINQQPMHKLGETARGKLRNKHLGFVYQFHHLLPEFTALENVAMPLMIGGKSVKESNQFATNMLGKVGLDQRLRHKPAELSGGERQRAAIARALITNPACMLADEPTGNLDRKTANRVFDMMLEINQTQNTSLLIVTHDTELANKMDRVMVLQDGVLSEND